MNSLNMTEVLSEAYKLADEITNSEEVTRYLQLKNQIEQDPIAQEIIHKFQMKKEKFVEAQRFGHFHPDYHQTKEEAEQGIKELKEHPVIGEYLALEETLDQLLNEVSRQIAYAVSETIKVPINDPKVLRQKNQKKRKGCG